MEKITYAYRLKHIKLHVEDWYNYIAFIKDNIGDMFPEFSLLESNIIIIDNHPCLNVLLVANGDMIYLKLMADISPLIEI
ncbi:MAG TPA: hypothetical protein ENG40_01015, partial [Thermoprotei archaeon]|nr:hypothetical protein [Thermoprotei archaeon]